MSNSMRRKDFILLFAYLVIIAGILTITGWQYDITALKSIVPGITPMNPVTAVTFILSGTWLIVFAQKQHSRLLLFILSMLITITGFIHFITYIFPNPTIRYDYLFYKDKIKAGHIFNLIAPNTAFVFFISGISMLTVNVTKKWVQFLRQAFIFIGFSSVYISLVGYLYKINYAYTFEHFTPMALSTSFVFILLNCGLFLSNTTYGISKLFTSRLNGGRMFRQVIIFLLLLPMGLGYVRLFGERRGLYPAEFGTGIYTLLFVLAEFVFIYLYALAINKKQVDQIKSEARLAESEHRFRTLFNTLQQGIYTIDIKGIVNFCNSAMHTITGYTVEELKGVDIIKLVIPVEYQNMFYEYLTDNSASKKDEFDIIVNKKDNEKIWVKLKIRPFLEEQGAITQFLVTVMDITQQRVRQEDLKAFTASAAHDLNAPIARIIMALSIFETDNLTEDQQELLNAISDTSVAMKQLLLDLLSFSKLGTIHLEKQPLDINKMVQAIYEKEIPKNFKGYITKEELPVAYGNDSAVKQLFTNLISNAIKYSSRKDTPDIKVGTILKNNATAYYVQDNGIGLSKNNIEELFTPFKRFHSNFEGNGMGLAIVKRIVEKHGGKIWVDSIPGKGSTFFFTL